MIIDYLSKITIRTKIEIMRKLGLSFIISECFTSLAFLEKEIQNYLMV